MVVGHREIMNNLARSVKEGMVSQSYLFLGPSGVGRKTVADAFISMLFCPDFPSPCGKCSVCSKLKNRNHPDVFYITTPQKKKSISVDDIRSVIGEAYIKPYEADKKVFVVYPADEMTTQAQNAILKILEEPPGYIVFILIAESEGKIVNTVLSRSRIIRFNPNTRNEVIDYLKETLQTDYSDFEFLADYSGGIIGKALAVAADLEFQILRSTLYDMLSKLHRSAKSYIYDLIGYITENKDKNREISELLTSWYRDALIISVSGNSNLIINKDCRIQLEAIADTISAKGLAYAVSAILEAVENSARNANFNLNVLKLCMTLSEIQ